MLYRDDIDVLVVGGGPAGLTAAIAAAEGGRSVLVCEQLDRPGLRLLATGGGRCNLTRMLATDAFVAAYGRQGRFASAALEAMDTGGGPAQSLRDLLYKMGVPTQVDPDGAVYPVSNSARDVHAALLRRCDQLGVQVRTAVRVSRIEHAGNAPPQTPPSKQQQRLGVAPGVVAPPVAAPRVTATRILVETSGGRIRAAAVILACGGRSYPRLGGGVGGYELARQAGHSIVPPTPALVGLIVKEAFLQPCAGASVRAHVWIEPTSAMRARFTRHARYPQGVTGDVLLTHRGLSGPAILDLSGDVAELLAANDASTQAERPAKALSTGAAAKATSVKLRVNLTPEVHAKEWMNRFADWQQHHGKRLVRTLLTESAASVGIPASLTRSICDIAGVSDAPASQFPLPTRTALAEALTSLPLTVAATEGFDTAMVTRGGVTLKEVNPRTLESRLLPGLFLAGELLDIDGPCGGYNLQWAFASGRLAGASAAKQ